jgi:glycosyltransferase involved in cell wall biosynthesis
MSRRDASSTLRNDVNRKVSIIITAHNEETRIAKKLRNTLELGCPRRSTEIVVASDASTDSTDEIVKRFATEGIRLVRSDVRKGKEHAQLLAINACSGDILLFTDVGTTITPGAVDPMLARLSDEKVGAVSCEDRVISSDSKIKGEGVYIRYEMWLRRLESSVRGLVGLSGCFFAARREVCQDWDIYSPSDFVVALNCAQLGYVAVSEPSSVAYYQDLADDKKEYGRKVRTVIRGLTGLVRHAGILNPFRYGLFAIEVWSHKVMRWLAPWLLLLLWASSLALAPVHIFYLLGGFAQTALYLTALIGGVWATLRTLTLVRIPFFFVQSNAAIAHATVAFVFGKRMFAWQPSQR